MPRNPLEQRVLAIERMLQDYVTVRHLERFEKALSEQIVQLRDEMRGEFSAVREEMHAGGEQTRRTLRDEIRAGDEETRRALREEIRAGDEQTRGLIEQRTGEILAVVAAGDEQTRRYMRLLYEDVIARIGNTGG